MYCILKNVDAIYIFSLFQKVILFQFHFESEDTFSPHVSLATLCEFKNTEKYGNIKNMKRIRKGASGYFSRSKSDQECHVLYVSVRGLRVIREWTVKIISIWPTRVEGTSRYWLYLNGFNALTVRRSLRGVVLSLFRASFLFSRGYHSPFIASDRITRDANPHTSRIKTRR